MRWYTSTLTYNSCLGIIPAETGSGPAYLEGAGKLGIGLSGISSSMGMLCSSSGKAIGLENPTASFTLSGSITLSEELLDGNCNAFSSRGLPCGKGTLGTTFL